jgi:hypothetical protein
MDVILRTQNTIRVCNPDIAIKWEFVRLFLSRSFTFETGICNKSKMLVRCNTQHRKKKYVFQEYSIWRFIELEPLVMTCLLWI